MTAARTRHTEPRTVAPGPCGCRPTLIATFRREQLVALELRHQRREGCYQEAQAVDVQAWRRSW